MRIILTGASGRMGKQMLALFQSTKDVEIFAVDKAYEYDKKRYAELRIGKVRSHCGRKRMRGRDRGFFAAYRRI